MGDIALIVGLGNTGEEYQGTRHNVGFEVLDRVADSLGAGKRRHHRWYDWCQARAGDYDVTLAWPTTLMNRSGRAVTELLKKLDITPERMLVTVDDFNLPLGTVRFRQSGSDGGHNGLASLIESLGTENFPRCRLGIGEPGDAVDVVDFVLSRFTADERRGIEPALRQAAEGAIRAVDHRFEEVMSQYNGNPVRPD